MNTSIPIVSTVYPLPGKLYTVDSGPEYMITITPGEDNPITLSHGDCTLIPQYKEQWMKFLFLRDTDSSREFVLFFGKPMMLFEKLSVSFGMVISNRINHVSSLSHLMRDGESLANTKDFARIVFAMMEDVKQFYSDKIQELEVM